MKQVCTEQEYDGHRYCAQKRTHDIVIGVTDMN